LKLIGTQRSAHTHKKGRKKIKEEVEELKEKKEGVPRTRSKSGDKKSNEKDEEIFDE
tara:strand:+ start:145 stop:315 length:171 start_codon:yes stop_codon:yes gene_type:complete